MRAAAAVWGGDANREVPAAIPPAAGTARAQITVQPACSSQPFLVQQVALQNGFRINSNVLFFGCCSQVTLADEFRTSIMCCCCPSRPLRPTWGAPVLPAALPTLEQPRHPSRLPPRDQRGYGVMQCRGGCGRCAGAFLPTTSCKRTSVTANSFFTALHIKGRSHSAFGQWRRSAHQSPSVAGMPEHVCGVVARPRLRQDVRP